MTAEKDRQEEKGKDLINEGREGRQQTMDKMSIDTSEAYTYDRNTDDDNRKCS